MHADSICHTPPVKFLLGEQRTPCVLLLYALGEVLLLYALGEIVKFVAADSAGLLAHLVRERRDENDEGEGRLLRLHISRARAISIIKLRLRLFSVGHCSVCTFSIPYRTNSAFDPYGFRCAHQPARR